MIFISKRFKIFTEASKVDFPAFGYPIKPTSAINFNFNSNSFLSPDFPAEGINNPFYYNIKY